MLFEDTQELIRLYQENDRVRRQFGEGLIMLAAGSINTK